MYRIAIDIGGTQLRIALIDEDYRIAEVHKTPNDRSLDATANCTPLVDWIRAKQAEGFELAGSDGKFYPAQARVALPYIELSCDKVKAPAAARFKWTNYADVGLFGVNGLPLAPFRTYTD